MAEEKINTKRLLITLGFVLVTALAIGGATWWAMNENCNANNTNKEDTKVATTVPSNFTKITVNGVDINVPSAWGNFKVTETPEDFSDEAGPGATFKGATASKNGDSWPHITVSEMSSVENVQKTNAVMKPYLEKALSFTKEIYATRGFEPEKFYEMDLPVYLRVNAGVKPYNPRYIESDDGEWRGVWFVANVGQDTNSDVTVIAAMYNQNTKKLLSFLNVLQTKKSEALWKKIDKEVQESVKNKEITEMTHADSQWEIDDYLQSAYFTDSEVKNFIDNEFLVVLKTL